MFGAKTIVLSWYWVSFPAAAVWTPLFVAAQSMHTSFLLLSIFRLHGCYFSRGSLVDGYWFQKHQPSRSTKVTKRGRDVGLRRNPDALLQIDKGGPHPKKHVCFDKKKKKKKKEKFRIFLLYRHISDFLLSSSLHRFQCSCSAKSSATGLCAPQVGLVYVRHTPAANACLWVKGKTTDFRAKKGKLLSQGGTHLKLKC